MRFRHGGHVDAIVFTPDGKRLISKGTDGVRVWDAATGKELRHLAVPAGELWHGSDLSSDGARLAVVHGQASSIDLWDVNRAEKIASLGSGDYSEARLSPDGKRLAVCSKLSGIELWDVPGRQRLQAWKAHKWQVWYLAFTTDSRRLVSSGTEGNIRFWDATTGRQLQELTLFTKENLPFPNDIRLAPDGKTLVIIERSEKQTSEAGPARWQARTGIWDTMTGNRVRQLICPAKEDWPNHAPSFGALTFTADGKQLITSGPDHFIRIWDQATGKELRQLPFDPQPSSFVALSGDGKTLAAVAGRRTAIQLLDLLGGKAHTSPEGYPANVSNPWFALLTPDGRTAITGSREKALLVWDVSSGRVRQRLEGYEEIIGSLRISPDGRTLIAHDYANTLHIRQLAHGEALRSLKLDFSCGGVNTMIVTPDGRSLVVEDSKGVIHLLDRDTAKERIHFQGPAFLWGLACTSDGRSLVGWSGDRKVRVWDLANGAQKREWPVPPDIRARMAVIQGGGHGSVYSAALSPDGRLLAMGSLRGPPSSGQKREYPLVFKDLATGQDIRRGDPLPWDPERLAFSPDGRLLAWSGSARDPAIHLLEMASGRECRRLLGHRGQITALHFSANGERLISGSDDTTALVWDVRGRLEPRRTLSAANREALWADLASADAVRSYQAIRNLTAAPASAVPFLRQRLHPVPPADEKRVARLIGDLDSNDFATRRKAVAELEKLDDRALPAYRKALAGQPSIETRRRLEELSAKAAPEWWNVSGERLRSLARSRCWNGPEPRKRERRWSHSRPALPGHG